MSGETRQGKTGEEKAKKTISAGLSSQHSARFCSSSRGVELRYSMRIATSEQGQMGERLATPIWAACQRPEDEPARSQHMTMI